MILIKLEQGEGGMWNVSLHSIGNVVIPRLEYACPNLAAMIG